MTGKKKRKQFAGKFKFPHLNQITFLGLVIFIIVVSSLFKISLNNNITEMHYKYELLSRQEVNIQQNIYELESKIANLSRPDRIRRVAKSRLNMVDPKPNINIVTIQ